jgi:archaellum biogenesis ATPase FlaH
MQDFNMLDPFRQLHFGSIDSGKICLVYGSKSSGKTLFALLASLLFSLKGQRVLFLSGTRQIPIFKFFQLVKAYRIKFENLCNIFFIRFASDINEAQVLRFVKEMKPSLLVYDNFTDLYINFLSKYPKLAIHYRRMLINFLAEIRHLIFYEDISVILTLGVSENYSKKSIGYNPFNYFSDYQLLLTRLSQKKHLYLARLPVMEKEERRFYVINEKGFKVKRAE